MILDCFNFFDELDLLELRLNELDQIVDRFVLVEGTVTFTNKKKPLYYEQNKSSFKKFHKKIRHIVVGDSPNVSNPWIIEHFQFDAILRGLSNCSTQDKILISCVDELPKAEKIMQYLNKPGKHKVFQQHMSYYYYNNFEVDTLWDGSRLFSYSDLLNYRSPYIARFTPPDLRIPDGGWHFSFIGDTEKIRNKIFAYSHQEYNRPEYTSPENIEIAIRKDQDIFGRKMKFEKAEDNLLPAYILRNREEFAQYLIDDTFGKSKGKSLYIGMLKAKSLLRKIVRETLTRLDLKS